MRINIELTGAELAYAIENNAIQQFMEDIGRAEIPEKAQEVRLKMSPTVANAMAKTVATKAEAPKAVAPKTVAPKTAATKAETPKKRKYTTEYIAQVAAQMITGQDRQAAAEKQTELIALLKEFNVSAIPFLKADQLDAFAERLKEMGADI